METRDFPGDPVVRISPSSAEDVGSIPGQGAKIPHTSQPKKHKKRSNIVTNSIKIFKMVNGPHQKKKRKRLRKKKKKE